MKAKMKLKHGRADALREHGDFTFSSGRAGSAGRGVAFMFFPL